jgi:hypothetical protein
MDSPELSGGEAKVSRQRNRVQPKLGGLIVSIDMDMRRLVRFVAEKNDTARPTVWLATI